MAYSEEEEVEESVAPARSFNGEYFLNYNNSQEISLSLGYYYLLTYNRTIKNPPTML